MRTLNEIFNEHGSDKGTVDPGWGYVHGYGPIYELLIGHLREKPIRLLEIGIWKGASLRSWLEYFPLASVFAMDNGSACTLEQISVDTKRSRIIRADQGDRQELKNAVESFGGMFDVIIDDGSHISSHQQTSLGFLFPYVVSGGLYIIEDLTLPGRPLPQGFDNSDTTSAIIDRRWNAMPYAISDEQDYLDQNVSHTTLEPDMTGGYCCCIIYKR